MQANLVRTILLSGVWIAIGPQYARASQSSLNHDLFAIIDNASPFIDVSAAKVEELLNRGANVNALGDSNEPAIVMAIIGNDAYTVRLLLAHNADLSLRYLGMNALEWAKHQEAPDLIRILAADRASAPHQSR